MQHLYADMATNSDNRKLYEALDERYRIDHDLLVRVDTRSMDMASDIREMKEGLMQEIGLMKAQININTAKIANFEASMRTVRWLLAGIASAVTFILSIVSGVFDLFQR